MAEIITMESPGSPKPKKFFSGWRAFAICALSAIIILAAFFSWWIASGRLSSSAARLDTVIYAVEPEFAATFVSSYVKPGQIVQAGQPLGRIDVTAGDKPLSSAENSGNMAETSARLNAAMQAEKEMAARVAQARQEEERLRAIWQDLSMRHSGALFRMRSLNPQYQVAEYQMARRAADEAQAQMENARDAFEKRSRMRAAQDAELAKIRGQLNLAKRGGKTSAIEESLAQPDQRRFENDLYAPVAGKIIKVNAEPMRSVNRGEALFLLLPTDKDAGAYWINAWYPIADKDRLKVGQKAQITFPSNGLRLSGRVASVDVPRESDSSSEKYVIVRVNLDDPAPARKLEPGTKAECRIQTRSIAGLVFLG